MLENWELEYKNFVKVFPHDYKRVLEERAAKAKNAVAAQGCRKETTGRATFYACHLQDGTFASFHIAEDLLRVESTITNPPTSENSARCFGFCYRYHICRATIHTYCSIYATAKCASTHCWHLDTASIHDYHAIFVLVILTTPQD
eukprot:scaffold35947_cov66-Skeletonema_marinoi.AAC.2